MSKATDLATKCFVFPDSAMGLRIFNEHELEAFYHAARAEALREAAEIAREINGTASLAAKILEMRADREGKE